MQAKSGQNNLNRASEQIKILSWMKKNRGRKK